MTNFWDYESQATYNRQQAVDWANKAQADTQEWLRHNSEVLGGVPEEGSAPVSDDNVFNQNKPLLDKQDYNQIVPQQPKPDHGNSFLGGVLGDIVGGVKDAAETVALGPINKPWDLLRPVQKVLEAEHKYIAQPIAKAALSPFGDYNSLPGIVRLGAETLFDPLTYIGPGEITGALRAGKLGLEARSAAPVLESLFAGPGSKAVAAHVLESATSGLASVGGALAAESVGLPGILGGVAGPLALGKVRGRSIDEAWNRTAPIGNERYIINPEKVRVYHATTADFEGLPDPSKARSHYDTSIPNSIYTSLDPEIAQYEGSVSVSASQSNADNYTSGTLSKQPEAMKDAFLSTYTGARTMPLTLKAGVKVFDPAIDPWPKGWEELSQDYKQGEIRGSLSYDNDSYHDKNTSLFDNIIDQLRREPSRDPYNAQLRDLFHRSTNGEDLTPEELNRMNYDLPHNSTEGRNALVDDLKKEGYQGIITPYEIIGFNKDIFEPAYNKVSMKDLARAEGEFAFGKSFFTEPNYHGGGSSMVPYNRDNPPPYAGEMTTEAQQKAVQQLADEKWINKFNAKVQAGKDISEDEMNHASEILARYGPNNSEGGPGAQKATTLTQLLAKVQSAPNDYTSAKSWDEVKAWAQQTRSFTQKARAQIAQTLTGEHLDKIKAIIGKGMRLQDTEATMMINENQRMRALGNPYGAAAGDTIRYELNAANKQGILQTASINKNGQTSTVVRDPNILSQVPEINALNPEFKLMTDGSLHVEDLMKYWKYFDLNDQQLELLNMLHEPVAKHMELERTFGINSPEEDENGFNTHRQLVKTTSPDVNGVLVEGPNGPVVATKPGTKQSFARAQIHPSKSAGIVAGNKYLPFAEGQQARVAQGYGAMADAWLNKALDYIGKKPTDLLPEEYTTGLKALTDQRSQTSWIQKEIGRALNSTAKKAWIAPKWQALSPDIQQLLDVAESGSNLSKKADRVAVWKGVQDKVNQIDANLKAQVDPLNEGKHTLLKQIVSGEDLSKRGEYTVGFQGRYFKPEAGQQLVDLTKNDAPHGIERTINTFNQSVRPIMATLDASFLGVQGLLAMFMHPLQYMTAMKNVFTNGYGDYVKSAMDAGHLDDFIQNGGHWAAKNDFSEFIFPSAIQRIPILGQAADVSNSWFSQFGNIMRMEMYKSGIAPGGVLKDFGSDIAGQVAKRQMLRNINQITGFNPTNPSSMEKTFTFAPRFFRSQMGLIADAVTKRQISDQGALRALGTLAVAGTGLTMAFNEALGQPTDFDPTSPNFMRIRWGGQDTSIFGTWDTLMRAVSKTVDQGPQAGAEYLARVKASPAIGKMLDLITGETLNGQKLQGGSVGNLISSAAKLAESSGPISATQLLTQPPDISDPRSIAMSGIQFLGTKSTPLSPYENMQIRREALSKQDYGKAWDQLEPYQQNNLRDKYNLTLPSISDIGKQMDYRQAISNRFTQEQDKVDNQFPVGKDWIDAYHNLKHEQVGAYAQWAQQNPEAAAQMRSNTPAKNANEQARQDFFKLFDQADREDWSPDILDQKLNDFQSSLTPEQQAYIDRNTGMHDSDRVKQYKAAQKVLSPYWKLQDQVWDKLKAKLPDSASAATLDDYTNNLIQKLQDSGMPDSVIVKRIQSSHVLKEVQRATTTLRERYRQAHPNVDAELVKWYGYTPVKR